MKIALSALAAALALSSGAIAAPTRQDQASDYAATRALADQGDAAARWRLGMMYLDGDGVAADEAAAYGHVRQAAEQGYRPAMISLAIMLAIPQGVAENDVEAREWYEKAARAGSSHALRGLGGMYLTGEGGPPDGPRAVAYLELARDGGDEFAGMMLQEIMVLPDPQLRQRIDTLKSEWVSRHGRPGPDEL